MNTYTKRSKGFTSRGSVHPPAIRCAHCQRKTNDFAGGHSRGLNGEVLCHPNAKNRPDCYKLVTTYKHPTPCTKKVCYESHADLLAYVEGN